MVRHTALTRDAHIAVPLICGAMYPCSNPELVAAASAAGAVGIVQPVSLTYVYGHDFRAGLRRIRRLTDRPIGMNALIEQSSRAYRDRMLRWIEIALEEGVRFFITSLGNPRWVVDLIVPAGGVVYHDVTERRWALKARDGGVHGLIGVNARAGGHAGRLDAEQLYAEVHDLGLPVVCAGGIGEPAAFRAALDLGYAGAQLGTRFIATTECAAHPEYKQAILDANASDIVLTERLTGLPVAVIRNEYVTRLGTRAGPLARFLLRTRRTKHLMRTLYALRSLHRLKRSALSSRGAQEYWQAGQSVDGIADVLPVAEVVRRFADALDG
ncbi:MAG TPA: nitronate monooxygenase [Gemmatimonadaceae bacterium]|nr:nitronate monooxygenase [Gemmatimonadaceae bacterium]